MAGLEITPAGGLSTVRGGSGAERGGPAEIGCGVSPGGAGCRADSPEADSPAVRAMSTRIQGRIRMIDGPARTPRSVIMPTPQVAVVRGLWHQDYLSVIRLEGLSRRAGCCPGRRWRCRPR